MSTKRDVVMDAIGNKTTNTETQLQRPDKETIHLVSFSGGKDSTTMLIRMLELNYPIDYIMFADIGYELPEMYDYIDKVEEYIGRPITRVKGGKSFEEHFYGKITRGKRKGEMRGFPLTLFGCYIARDNKVKPMLDFESQFDNLVKYIGITPSEVHRSTTKAFIDTDTVKHKFPLIEWNWNEDKCLEYLKSKGLEHPMKGMRSGCWMCPKQPIQSLRYLHDNHPEKWNQLIEWEIESSNNFRRGVSVLELDERFNKE